jgi:predicted nuclease with TOPRIM domain
MAEPAIHRSQRFTKAARAERDRLARRRSQVFKKREELQAKIDSLDEELEAVDQQILMLGNLAATNEGADQLAKPEPAEEGNLNLLSGHAIRALAVPLLMHERGTAPIHYRDWLELLTRKGYTVAGKRPDAVFLNQVVRSPLVRATTRSGYYALDFEAVDQLRERLRQQQAESAELLSTIPTDVAGFEKHRERQRELNTALGRTERELDEALKATETWDSSEGPEAKAA